MNTSEKIAFFEAKAQKIINHPVNALISFIAECTDKGELLKVFKTWPSEIKILVVDKFIEQSR